MAYTGTLVAGGPGNFGSPNTAQEHDGVAVDFITVDYISAVNGEVTHRGAAANTAVLQLSMEAIQNQGVNILGRGVLSNSHTEQTYMVRRDSLDTISTTTTVAAIQAARRAIDALTPDKITLTMTSVTAADRDMGKLTAMA